MSFLVMVNMVIYFQGTDSKSCNNNIIQGNKIGTDESGDIALPNQIGIASLVGDNTLDNTIGGDVPEARNTISGNSNNRNSNFIGN